jgi:L-asparaginase II
MTEIPALPDQGEELLTVQVWRGAHVESRHRVSAVVIDGQGKIVARWGDPEQLIFPRSAIKPLQALPLIATGAADAFGVHETELAIACGSHRGRPGQVQVVARWLERLGLSASDLACGAHWPADEEAARALAAEGEKPSALHNNCSGKHVAMLATALHKAEPKAGYIELAHPVQKRVIDALEALSGVSLANLPKGIDGCSLPAVTMPLRALSLAFCRLAQPSSLAPPWNEAAIRVKHAMFDAPDMVEGSGTFCTEALKAGRGKIVLKPGGEGVIAAGLAEAGFALKVADGHGRAAQVAAMALIARFARLDDATLAALAPFARPVLKNHAGRVIGHIALV